MFNNYRNKKMTILIRFFL